MLIRSPDQHVPHAQHAAVTDYTYAIDYAIGGLDPTAYHATGIVLHATTSVLVYVFAWLTLGAVAGAAPCRALCHRLGAAALFAAHPLASETVACLEPQRIAAAWVPRRRHRVHPRGHAPPAPTSAGPSSSRSRGWPAPPAGRPALFACCRCTTGC
jgi:hypothetical protein